MATMLAVDVLGCTGTTEERAGLLHKIIQIAAELKSTVGNMFGFAAVMRALELPQVNRQHAGWIFTFGDNFWVLSRERGMNALWVIKVMIFIMITASVSSNL